MLQLASWIMRGRVNALVAAAILGLVPLIAWISVSVVALVALRRNAADAIWPLAGALMAAAIQWSGGDVSQMGALLAAGVGAIVLARTRALSLAVLVTALASALYLVVLVQVFPGQFDQLLALFQPLFDQLRQQGAEPALLDKVDLRTMVIEGTGLLTGVTASCALLLARSLQARLYNPGGFREEFHRLRMMPASTTALVAGMLVSQWQPAAVIVVPVLVLPLAVAGLGLVHGLVALRPASRTPLVLFYLALVLFAGPMLVLLVGAAIMDSFIDFRKRIGAARP